jgi:hypothetical protein
MYMYKTNDKTHLTPPVQVASSDWPSDDADRVQRYSSGRVLPARCGAVVTKPMA